MVRTKRQPIIFIACVYMEQNIKHVDTANGGSFHTDITKIAFTQVNYFLSFGRIDGRIDMP